MNGRNRWPVVAAILPRLVSIKLQGDPPLRSTIARSEGAIEPVAAVPSNVKAAPRSLASEHYRRIAHHRLDSLQYPRHGPQLAESPAIDRHRGRLTGFADDVSRKSRSA